MNISVRKAPAMQDSLTYLQSLLNAGKINRRDFIKGATALGLTAVTAQSLFAGKAQTVPMKGGRLRVALAEGSTTDSLDPQTYTDVLMMSNGFALRATQGKQGS